MPLTGNHIKDAIIDFCSSQGHHDSAFINTHLYDIEKKIRGLVIRRVVNRNNDFEGSMTYNNRHIHLILNLI